MMHRPDFLMKLQQYNKYYEGKPKQQVLQIDSGTEDVGVVYRGSLRVYWGLIQPIRLKLKDDAPPNDELIRHSFNGSEPSQQETQLDYFLKLSKSSSSGVDQIIDSPNEETCPKDRPPSLSSSQISRSQSSVVMRPNRKRPVKKRQSIINGHLFSAETSMFTPMHGTPMSVVVSSLDSTFSVIKSLLNKFKVDNSPSEFCLCAIRASGETRTLAESNAPLMERVCYGPLEDDVKFYLVEKYRVVDINEEVANFVNLPDAVLEAFLMKYSDDEKLEMEMIKERYRIYGEKLEEMLGDVIPAT